MVYITAMDRSELTDSIMTLLERTSTVLPEDIHEAIVRASAGEAENSDARETLNVILESTDLSRDSRSPICQDTGALFAIIRARKAESFVLIDQAIRDALAYLTARGMLRQNCVDSITDKNTGNNMGEHVPQIHFIPWQGPTRISVMFKGGGSENVSTQYALPCWELDAGRDFDGVRKCILDAVFRAQGKGCAPGILGICIGGDRASGYLIAKEQLFRKLYDRNDNDALARLEDRVLEQANTLGIGPMGLGGKTTLLGVKIGSAGRHPACYYVTISYSCWATRRSCIELDEKGAITQWL